MNTDKSLILNKLKNHYSFKKDSDFARYLGIKPQTLASWYSRKTFDIDILYSKCNDISADYLLTGKGEMLRDGYKTGSIKVDCNDKIDIIAYQKEIISMLKEKLDDCESEKKLHENNKSNV